MDAVDVVDVVDVVDAVDVVVVVNVGDVDEGVVGRVDVWVELEGEDERCSPPKDGTEAETNVGDEATVGEEGSEGAKED